ncbi:MAG: pitrilysin family protein [Gemmataceae bacterium]
MIHQHTFANGLTLLAEPMDYVRSATAYLMVPCGAAFDPPETPGIAGVLSDMMSRGAGSRNSRELSSAFDALGVDRGESVDTLNLWFSGGTLGRNLPASLELFADVIRRPHLPADELEPAQALALQDIQALDDSPQEKVMLELKKRYLPPPLNADKLGTVEGIEAITADLLRAHHQKYVRPNGAIFAVAGNIDWSALKDQVERLFGDWERGDNKPVAIQPHRPQSAHLEKDTQQTQIAMAFPSASIADADYYAARGTIGVLSGGMSARLFTEVREKRGLCYSVFATHESFQTFGALIAYAGTRADRAQETLDVMTAELRKLKDGVEADEIERVKAGLKASLIMRQESTSARAGAIASDWFLLGRVRSFDEIQTAIDGLTAQAVVDCAVKWPASNLTVVTLGPKELSIPR